MEMVAARARISKNSLYREYPSKAALFAAVISDWVDRGHDAMRPHTAALLDASDTAAGFQRLARVLQAAVLSPPVLQMRTLIASEAPRFPEVAADYVERSWNRNLEMLADAFAVLAQRGYLGSIDAKVAAEQFTWLAIASPLNRLTLEAGAYSYGEADLDLIAREAVATFMTRFGA